MQLPDNAPFSEPQKTALNGLLASLAPEQLIYLNGFFGALATAGATAAPAAAPGTKLPVTILYGTESGNCEVLADDARKALAGKGMKPTVKNMADVQPGDLAKVENLLVIVSTWGEGDPPDAAVPFHTAFMGDGAPRLPDIHFSVCALGDTAYEQFCQTGKEFDHRLEALGGHRIAARTDCDVDYEEPFSAWLETAIRALECRNGAPAAVPAITPFGSAPIAAAFGKKNPFPAELIDHVLLSGEGSAKETRHFELSLEGSGLTYLPGDSLAVIPTNALEDIGAVLEAGKLDGDSLVAPKDSAEVTLHDALLSRFDITGLTKIVLQKYNALAGSKKIAKLLEPDNREALNDYLWGRQIVDMLADFPVKGLAPADLIGILRKLPPRLYSIASSPKAHPDEVHLTVAAVRYHTHGRDRIGVASTYLADRVKVGETIPVYTHASKTFKLPTNPDTPIIMVGPGTGIAPFRAFVEDRAADGAKGQSWLFFGDQRYSFDFLYQLEWQDHLKSGALTKLDVAFSRDQPKKYYVQDVMRERAKELYAWLEDGAHFYVCGDASRMAHDVHSALVDIIAEHGGRSREDAEAYTEQLKKDRRYQRDVY